MPELPGAAPDAAREAAAFLREHGTPGLVRLEDGREIRPSDARMSPDDRRLVVEDGGGNTVTLSPARDVEAMER